MSLYFELLQKPVFSAQDILALRHYNKISGARSAIKSLIKQGMVAKIRNNMYTCISGETGYPVADRFQIASSIHPYSYVSHYSALEYYGLAGQVYHEVYVASPQPFSDFEFSGCLFHHVQSVGLDGVEIPKRRKDIRVTNLERTLIDSIHDMDKIGGIEEITESIACMEELREEYLLRYLEMYDCQFLYQKTGYMLWNNRKALGLSPTFFESCQKKIGKSKRYLSSDYKEGKFDNNWKLVIPNAAYFSKNGVENA